MKLPTEEISARTIIQALTYDVLQAQDNLLQAKVLQAFQVNKQCGPEVKYSVGDKVMLTTLHRCNKYKQKDKLRMAKFMPQQDSPCTIVEVHLETSSYTLDLPNSPNIFPTFHGSELSLALENDTSLFPSRSVPVPTPILMAKGYEEQEVEAIIDECRRGRGMQYLVCWKKLAQNMMSGFHNVSSLKMPCLTIGKI